jgi:small multidrug resistance pump
MYLPRGAVHRGEPRRAWISPWLRAAALYNAAWGLAVLISPASIVFPLRHLPSPDLVAWRAVGMMVLVYAPMYWWASSNLGRARPIVAVGLLGKALGVAGFLSLAVIGVMPWAFGWTIVTNDLIWIPPFVAYLVIGDEPTLSRRSLRSGVSTVGSAVLGSPYSTLFGRDRASLPSVFAAQFLAPPKAGVVSVAMGRLARVWCDPGALRPFLAVLGRMGILIPRTGVDVPMSLVLRAGIDRRGNPFHECERNIALPGARFVTRKTFDRALGMLVESMGPTGVLQVAWDTQLRFGRGLLFRQIGLGIRVRGRTVWLAEPLWMVIAGRARFVQLASPADGGRVGIRFTLRHPIFGRCFGYEGAFRLTDLDAVDLAAAER